MIRGLLTLVAILALTTGARGDTIVLKDGTALTGDIVRADKTLDQIVIKVRVGSSTASLTVKYSDVASLQLGPAAPPAPPAPAAPRPGPAGPAKPGGAGKTVPRPRRLPPTVAKPATPTAKLEQRVVFLVDASGSMAIGQRWAQAIELVQTELERLPNGTLYDVLLFHDQVVPLFTVNNSLTKTPKSATRTARRLKGTEPDLRRGTNLGHALTHQATRRAMARLVIVTDGVLTRGGPSGPHKALGAIRAARARGVKVDVFAAQDGTYQAKSVEDKTSARKLLARYAQAGRGVFRPLAPKTAPAEVLPTGFKPIPGTHDGTTVPWRIEVISTRRYRDFKHWEAQWRVVTGVIPLRFRVRVWDPRVNRGEFLDVWEYGGAVWIDVHTPRGEVLNLRLHRSGDKQTLVTDRAIRLVGPKDENLKRGARHDRRYAYVQGMSGDAIRIVYRRGNERFTVHRTTGGSGRDPDSRPPRPPALPPESPAPPALAEARPD